ncbi:lytic transglycosylase [Mycoavidus cysteinexigens]|uniref:Lytic transglycosylase n=1 Tax=Mycoavidus cysteinexigens TaxID=1553431 RepID=A0A2Z6ES70_9BURK|nr:lytic transglycosylase [Mycoavidus cysteinexigens]GAM53048.1 soluble lytic murein transglycosylase precursor [bacterium endosymbiont of Mortierella elongata FMR23-6]GLR01975.1 lytic transglycosylase [Mycoavidus cysteinexigens]
MLQSVIRRVTQVYRVLLVGGALATLVSCSTANAARAQPESLPTEPDAIFLALREAAQKNDAPRAFELARRLPAYPSPSYVEYFALKPQLFDASGQARLNAPDTLILNFLQKYEGQAIADRMRNDYLLVLGARHAWHDFDEQYQRFALKDDLQLKCYALQAQAAHGREVAEAARALLVAPNRYGNGCVELISVLTQKKQFEQDDIWQQIRLAYEINEVAVGNRIADALGPQRPSPKQFAMAVTQPQALLEQGVPINTAAHQLALLAITRIARQDPILAAAIFTSIAERLTPQEQATGWGTIAYRAALEKIPLAPDWYQLATDGWLSNPAYEWRVRAALLAENWPMVLKAIEMMPGTLRHQPVWIYWQGRGLRATGESALAVQAWRKIASNFDFYGQLATEELGRQIALPPTTALAEREAEIKRLQTLPGFQLAEHFYRLQMYFEGAREWNWTLRGMSDRQLLAAAELARRLKLYDRAVNTAERTRQEHDFKLRYIAPLRDLMERNAKLTDLDPAWAYGLIRQESRFISDARSSVGATGLMQLMPGTAQLVARKIGLGKISSAKMNDVETNILLGMNYLAMMYAELDASPVLASAAYNAGPHRAQKWRAALTRPIEGAIFAETIPFNETRDYVKKVLANTVYYATLLNGTPQSLKARLGVIAPQNVPEALPQKPDTTKQIN